MAIGASSDAAKSQKRSQAFTRQMMKKAHQWEVDDLILAGLNPILSATGGSGPMGASPAPFGSDASSALDVAQAGGAVSRGVGEAVRSAAAPQLTASEKKIRAFQETTAGHEARRVGFVASKEQELEQVAHHEARLSKANATLAEARIPAAQAVEAFDKTTTGRDIARWNRLFRQAAGPLNLSSQFNVRR